MNIQPLNLKQKSLDSFVKTKSTRVTKEAEEALAVQLHLDGLKHLNEGNLDLAKESFHLLLQSSFLADCKAKDVGGEETSANKALDSISLKLEYSCLKNLGLIALEESQDSTALSHFLLACELDRTDVTLLQHLANTAMRLGDFMIARHALEQNVHLSPSHWPSLSALCRLLFAIEDYPACLNLLLTALEAKEDNEEGLCYLQWIMENRPYLCHGQIELWKYTCKAAPSVYDKVLDEIQVLRSKECSEAVQDIKPPTVESKITQPHWVDLGQHLLQIYRQCISDKSSLNIHIPVDSLFEFTPVDQGLGEGKDADMDTTQESMSDSTAKDSEVDIKAGTKRKVPDFPLDYIPKRRSSRVKLHTKKIVEVLTIMDSIESFIPPGIRVEVDDWSKLPSLIACQEVKMDTLTEDYAQKKTIRRIHENEALEVCKFTESLQNNRGVTDMMYHFVVHLSGKWEMLWPKELKQDFISCVATVVKHIQLPASFGPLEADEERYCLEIGSFMLLFMELWTDNKKKKQFDTAGGQEMFVKFLSFLQGTLPWIASKGHILSIRMLWCLAVHHGDKKEDSVVLELLHQCKDALASLESDVIHLPNFTSAPVISQSRIDQKIKVYQDAASMIKICDQYCDEDYDSVAHALLVAISEKQMSFKEIMHPPVGILGFRETWLDMLLLALRHLDRRKDSLCVGLEGLKYLLSDECSVTDRVWYKEMGTIFRELEWCLSKDEQVISDSDSMQVLLVVAKSLDILMDHASVPSSVTFPFIAPWIVVYNTLSKLESSVLEQAEGDPVLMETSPTFISKDTPVTTSSIGPPVTTSSLDPSVTTSSLDPSVTTSSIGPPVTTLSIHPSVTTSSIEPPVTTSSLGPPLTTSSIGPPVTSSSIGPPVTTLSIGPPVTTSSTGPPVTTSSIGPPLTTSSIGPPVTTSSIGPPVTTSSTGPPVTTSSIGPPVTTSSIGPPVTTSSIGPPVTTSSTGPPVTTSSIGPPVTTSSIGPPVTTSSIGPPVTTSSIGPPVTTSSTGPPVTTTHTTSSPALSSDSTPPSSSSVASLIVSSVSALLTHSSFTNTPLTTVSSHSSSLTDNSCSVSQPVMISLGGNVQTVASPVGTPLTTSSSVSTPLTTASSIGTPLTTASSIGTPLTTASSIGTPLTTASSTGIQLTTAPSTDTPLTTASSIGTPLTTASSIGTPLMTASSIGTPLTTASSIGTPLTTASSIGTPLTTVSSIGTPLTTASSIGTPLTTASSTGIQLTTAPSTDTPLMTASSIGTPLTAASSFGTPRTTASSIGTPLTTISSVGTPLTKASSIVTPRTTASSIGTSLTAVSSIGTPLTAASSIGTPLTAASSIGTPITTGSSIGTPQTKASSIVTPLTTASSVGSPLVTASSCGSLLTLSECAPSEDIVLSTSAVAVSTITMSTTVTFNSKTALSSALSSSSIQSSAVSTSCPTSIKMDVSESQSSMDCTPIGQRPCVGRDHVSITENRLYQYLKFAHERLGSYGWCSKEDGRLLKLFVDVINKENDLVLPVAEQHELVDELYQCYRCLYGFPLKTDRGQKLSRHASESVEMTWSAALELVKQFHPTQLPKSWEAKHSSTHHSDLVTLYKKVLDLMPKEVATATVVDKEALLAYLNGRLSYLAPYSKPSHSLSHLLAEVYYVLADDCLQRNDFKSSYSHYFQSLCYFPELDCSWIGLSLSISKQTLSKLSSQSFDCTSDQLILNIRPQIIRCLKKVVMLNNTVAIEQFGLLLQCMFNYMCQLVKQGDCVDRKLLKWATEDCVSVLELARECIHHLIAASSSDLPKEWARHYMLAIVTYKLKGSISTVIEHILSAQNAAFDPSVTLPKTIELSSKHPSVIGAVLSCQFFTCILKTLLRGHEGSSEVLSVLQCQLSSITIKSEQTPSSTLWVERVIKEIVNQIRTVLRQEFPVTSPMLEVDSVLEGRNEGSRDNPPIGPQLEGKSQQDCFSKWKSASNLSSSELERLQMLSCNSGDPKAALLLAIAQNMPAVCVCLDGIASCALRIPNYSKPLYQLSKLMYRIGLREESFNLLVGPLPEELVSTKDQHGVPPLALKGNIFSNMWRLPVKEFDYPGVFFHLARKQLDLLLNILYSRDDFDSLLFVFHQIRNKPDYSRVYMRDCDRLWMTRKCVQYCSSTLRKAVEKAKPSESEGENMEELVTLTRKVQGFKKAILRIPGLADTIFESIKDCLKELPSREDVSKWKSTQSVTSAGVSEEKPPEDVPPPSQAIVTSESSVDVVD